MTTPFRDERYERWKQERDERRRQDEERFAAFKAARAPQPESPPAVSAPTSRAPAPEPEAAPARRSAPSAPPVGEQVADDIGRIRTPSDTDRRAFVEGESDISGADLGRFFRGAGRVARASGRALVRGAGQVLQSGGEFADLVADEAWSAPGARQLGRGLTWAGEKLIGSVPERQVGSWRDALKSPEAAATYIGETVGEMVPSMAPGVGAAKVLSVGGKLSKARAFTGAATSSYIQNVGQTRKELEELGVEQEKRNEAALIIGAPMALLDAIAPTRIGTRLGAESNAVSSEVVRQLAKRRNPFFKYLGDAVAEGIPEGFQEATQYAGTRWASPADDFEWQELGERTLEGTIQGFFGGGVGSPIIEAVDAGVSSLKKPQGKEAVDAAAVKAEEAVATGTAVPAQEVPAGSHEAEAAPVVEPAPENWQEERRRLERAAYIDELTGLGNRAALNRHRERVEAEGEPVEYVSLDLEALKPLNDTQGEEAGNAALQRVSVAMAQAADELGIESRNLYRHGGDEFSAVVPEGMGDQFLTRARELMGEQPIPGTTFANRLGGAVGKTWVEATEGLAEYKRNRPKERQSRPSVVDDVARPEGASEIVRLPTAEMVARPEQMQFKSNVDPETGAGQELKNVGKWNDQLAGVIAVWKDPETGENVVVNGHHRFELANRLNVPSLNVQFIEAANAQEARAIGAYMNIAEGRGTGVDVAKFMRDTGATQADLESRGVSLAGSLAKRGAALSQLDADLFDQVARGRLDEGQAAAIAEATTDPALQREAVKIVRQAGGRMSQAEVREVARQVAAAGSTQTTQETLFGEEQVETALFVPRAKLVAALKTRLGRDKRLFSFIADEARASALEGVGNTRIDREAASAASTDAAAVTELFDRLYTRGGELASIITDGARQIAEGAKPKEVARELQTRIAEAIRNELAAARPAGDARSGDRAGEEVGRAGPAAPEAGPSGDPLSPEDGRVADSTDPSQETLLGSPDLFGGMDVGRGGQGEMFSNEEVDNRELLRQRMALNTARRIAAEQGGLQMGGAITPDEMAARRDELGLNAEAVPGADDPRQSDIFAARSAGPDATPEQKKALDRLAEIEGAAVSTPEVQPAADVEAEHAAVDADSTTLGYPEESAWSPANQATEWGKTVRKATGEKRTRSEEEVKSLRKIGTEFYDAIGAWGEQGRSKYLGPRKALGWYNTFFENIRMIRWDMGKLHVAFHEAGHYISKWKLGWPANAGPGGVGRRADKLALTPGALQELEAMGRRLYGKRKPNGGYGEEGIAEWVAFWVTDPQRAYREAPEFSAIMDEVFAADAELYEPLRKAQIEYDRHIHSSASARFAAMISERPSRWGLPSSERLIHLLFDDLRAVKMAMRTVANIKGGSLKPSENVLWHLRLLKGVAQQTVNVIQHGWPTTNRIGEIERSTRPLQSAWDMIPVDRHRAFRDYLVAMRVLEKEGQGIDTGFEVDDAIELTSNAAQQEFRAAAEIVWENQRAMLMSRVGTRMTKAEADRVAAMNRYYVRFARVRDEADAPSRSSAGDLTSSGLKRMKGSSREIIDPRESMMTDVFATLMDTRIHRAVRSLARMANLMSAGKVEGSGAFIQIVDAPKVSIDVPFQQVVDQLARLGLEVTAKDMDQLDLELRDSLSDVDPSAKGLSLSQVVQRLSFYVPVRAPRSSERADRIFPIVDGDQVYWVQVKDPALYRILTNMSEFEVGAIEQVLSAPARMFRLGTTGTPEFGIATNMPRDAQEIAVYSRSGKISSGIPGVLAARGLFSVLRKDDAYHRFMQAGGGSAGAVGWDRAELRQMYQKLLQRPKGVRQQLWYAVRHPIDTLGLLSELGENATRIGESKTVYREAVEAGLSEEDAAIVSTIAGREGTLDFSLAGALARVINRHVPFTTAALGGTRKFVQTFGRPTPAEELMPGEDRYDRMRRAYVRALIAQTIPAMAVYLLQHDDEEWDDIPDWQKIAANPIILRDKDGKHVMTLLIPKVPLLGTVFGTIPQALMEWLKTEEPKALKVAASRLKDELNPLGTFNPLEALMSAPAITRPWYEIQKNRSEFFDRPVVPEALLRLEPSDQYTDRTPETWIALGQMLNISPAQLEHFWRGYTGTMGTYPTAVTDQLIRSGREAVGAEPLKPEKPARESPTLTKLPMTRRWFRTPASEGGQTISDFYDAVNAAEEKYLTWNRRREAGKEMSAEAYRAQHRQEVDAMMPGGAARSALNEMRKLRNQLREIDQRGGTAEERRNLVADMERIAADGRGHLP